MNTPHSWQHVIGVLSWLVDVITCMNGVDVYEMMFPTNLSNSMEDNSVEDEDDFKIDKNVCINPLSVLSIVTVLKACFS